MVRSMTGFGRCKMSVNEYDINIDIKSVNHRYLDLNIKLPKYYAFLEEKIREKVSSVITRGKIEVSVYIKLVGSDEKEIVLNEPLCENYISVLTALKNKLGTDDKIDIRLMSRFNDIFELEYKEADELKVANSVMEVLGACLDDFILMREREGQRIKEDLQIRLTKVEKLGKTVEERAPQIVSEYREKLYAKLKEILGSFDEQRVIQEAAIYADKITTAEETVRLSSHIKEFNSLLERGEAVGKKLDFIVQEMNREVNTIGSKCNDFETSKVVVELKSEIENIREQIQNIE
ncbi:MAG: YicC family protein [Ruminococcaceae bacterium]|nr:YicC family protein [Oscillospiraceae bacterium]